jgi:polyvinyl alcohol dehydrogenase (cytochrome)
MRAELSGTLVPGTILPLRFSRSRIPLIVGIALAVCISGTWVGHSFSGPSGSGAFQSSTAVSTLALGTGSNYPTYLGNVERTDNAGSQGPISTLNAHSLQPLWSYATGGSVWSQAIVVNGVVYFGSSDGYEYALDATNGTFLWKTFLGVDGKDAGCPGTPGVTSTPTYLDHRLYLSGGNSTFYSLNATNGRILWQLPIGGTDAQGFYLWASPLIYKDSAYVGIASQCDVPLVPAGLEKVSLATHREVAYFNSSVPNPNGSSIWGTPSINERTNTIYVTTGNPYGRETSKYGESIIALNATTLSVVASWQVPPAQTIGDGDFGVTPTLFNLANGLGVVTAENKNGYLYEWYQSNLTLVWEDQIASVKDDHFSTSEAYGSLFAVGLGATIGATYYDSSISAINPDNGAYLWRVGINSSADDDYAPALIVNHVLAVPVARTLHVLDAATGQGLYKDLPGGIMTPPASSSRGEIFAGAGPDLVAYDEQLELTASQSRPSGPAPLNDSFIAAPRGGIPPYSYNWSFGNGTFSTAKDPTHIFGVTGAYTVTLRVTDLTGNVVNLQLNVTVSAPAGRWPRIPLPPRSSADFR